MKTAFSKSHSEAAQSHDDERARQPFFQKKNGARAAENQPFFTAVKGGAIQKKADGGGSSLAASPALFSKIASKSGGGQPLPDSTRSKMESGFGHDFSGVRIHADSEAHEMSQSIQAQAFTTGRDVFFNEGKYQPESGDGRRLLAHELGHVVQQDGGKISRQIQRSANTCTYGEVREWAITSQANHAAPANLGDVKASIGAVCGPGNCNCVDGTNAVAAGDRAAWANIVAAVGVDQSAGANYMCVGSQGCGFVHECRPVYQPGEAVPPMRERTQNLAPVATLTLNGHSIYFYSDPRHGNCPPAPRPAPAQPAR